jgi:hypothetical protein
MKKLYYFILMSLSVLAFHSNVNAQCSTVTVEAFPLEPQSGNHNYFGVRVTLAQTYDQNVTVNGYIYDQGEGANTDHPFELTVTTGNLTAETSSTFYETSPAIEAIAEISSVTPCPVFDLSEEESQTIIESSGFQIFIRLRNEFLDKIDSAVNQASIPLDSIKAAVLDAITNNNYQSFYSKLFSSNEAGESLIDSIVAARDALLTANPYFEANSGKFTCETCDISLTEKINYFFNNFEAINTNRYTNETEENAYAYEHNYNSYTSITNENIYAYEQSNNKYASIMNDNMYAYEKSYNKYTRMPSDNKYAYSVAIPTCGSWWNQLKLGACALLCSVTTAGIATPFCGWLCWCEFCRHHSALGERICANPE